MLDDGPTRTWTAKFRDAFRGVRQAARGQTSFRVHFAFAAAVLVAAAAMRMPPAEWAILLLCIGLVLTGRNVQQRAGIAREGGNPRAEPACAQLAGHRQRRRAGSLARRGHRRRAGIRQPARNLALNTLEFEAPRRTAGEAPKGRLFIKRRAQPWLSWSVFQGLRWTAQRANRSSFGPLGRQPWRIGDGGRQTRAPPFAGITAGPSARVVRGMTVVLPHSPILVNACDWPLYCIIALTIADRKDGELDCCHRPISSILLSPAQPMNRSAGSGAANSAGTAVFAVESGSLATSESIDASRLRVP